VPTPLSLLTSATAGGSSGKLGDQPGAQQQPKTDMASKHAPQVQGNKKQLSLNQPPTMDRWKSMVHKAEEAANALAKEHPRSVLGAHWRDVTGPRETLQDDSVAAAKAGKAAQDQLVQLAKDHLKQKGIYAPAAMCEKDNLPCPGTLRAQETSTGHYAPVRDNGPAPGEQLKTVHKAKTVKGVMPAPARYPAVSFYAKMREELSEKEKARLAAGSSHRTSLEMLAPGQNNRRPDHNVKEHREREEHRDEEKRRKEDELRRERLSRLTREQVHHSQKRRVDVHKEVSSRNINNHLYKMFSGPSGETSGHDERLRESYSRPSADELKFRDSIRSIEGSKLYQEEMDDDDEADPAEEARQKKMRGQLRIKQAQERMAVRWRQIMSHPPRRNAATRPDMLDPRELLTPRVGFKAKKKELDDFKNAIEMYESDPEMNPMTMIQAHHLSQYGVMPPESDSARDWQAWYREATDKAQILSDQVAMLASPTVDAQHRWDHGSPGDWCGTGGCRTLAHEQAGHRYVASAPPAPDKLERSITNRMNKAVLSGEDKGGRMPTEVTISTAPAPRLEDRSRRDRGHLPSLRSRHREYSSSGAQQQGYSASEHRRDERREREHGNHGEYRHHEEERTERAYQERMAYDREYERDAEREGSSRSSRRGYEERDMRDEVDNSFSHTPAHDNAPVKQLYGKVDQLQDEVSHLVKILSRRQMAHRGGERGDERSERRHQGRRQEEREDGALNTFREHDGVVRMGNTDSGRDSSRHEEAREDSDSHSDKARLAARHVVDWLRGAMLAARV